MWPWRTHRDLNALKKAAKITDEEINKPSRAIEREKEIHEMRKVQAFMEAKKETTNLPIHEILPALIDSLPRKAQNTQAVARAASMAEPRLVEIISGMRSVRVSEMRSLAIVFGKRPQFFLEQRIFEQRQKNTTPEEDLEFVRESLRRDLLNLTPKEEI